MVLRRRSEDGTNRLSRECVLALREIVEKIRAEARPLVIAGNARFFSAGAELGEIALLDGPSAYEFSKMGQALMDSIEQFPAPGCMRLFRDTAWAVGWIWRWHVIGGSPRPMPSLDIAALLWDRFTGWGGSATVAAARWQGRCAGNICGGGEDQRAAGVGDWIGGGGGRGSGGGGFAEDRDVRTPRSAPQALKRGDISNGLRARMNSCPSRAQHEHANAAPSDSRFLTGLSARFGMTRLCDARPYGAGMPHRNDYSTSETLPSMKVIFMSLYL